MINKEDLFDMADGAGLNFIRHASEEDVKKFKQLATLIGLKYRQEVLDTIEALFDSEAPNPMYQVAYNHALLHVQEFVINMEKQ